MERTIYIFGAGALGLRVALALAPKHPVLIARKAQSSRALVRALSPSEEVLEQREIALEPLETLAVIPDGAVLLICTKALAVKGLLEHLMPLINQSHTVVLAQNGIGVYEIAARVVPPSQVVRLTARFGALKVGAFSFVPTGAMALSVASNADAALRAAKVRALFEAPGAEVTIAPTVAACEWQKAALNIVLNSIATLLDSPNSVVLQDSELWRLTDSLLAEVRAVASAEGVELGEAASLAVIRVQIEAVAGNVNSTLSDLRAGRASETPWMLGAFVERARGYGVATPVGETLLALLTAMERLALLQRPG